MNMRPQLGLRNSLVESSALQYSLLRHLPIPVITTERLRANGYLSRNGIYS